MRLHTQDCTLGVLDAAQMGVTRKFLMAVVAPHPSGNNPGVPKSKRNPTKKIYKKIVVLKDAAQQGRIYDLDGFAVGFLILLSFLGFYLKKIGPNQGQSQTSAAAPPWRWVKLMAVTIPWPGSLFLLLALAKITGQREFSKGC